MSLLDEISHDAKPTLGTNRLIEVQEKEINDLINRWSKQFPHLQKQYAIGQLYRSSRNHSKSGIDMMIQITKALKEVLDAEFKENNNNEKIAIINNDIKSMEHMLILLKQANIDIDRDNVLMMLRGFVS